jgi:hypothetical protein
MNSVGERNIKRGGLSKIWGEHQTSVYQEREKKQNTIW